MKKEFLEPTEENIVETFIHDTFDRNEVLKDFYNIINLSDESTVIAIDGNWGSGKTFFVKQLKMLFDYNNNFTNVLKQESKEELQTYLLMCEIFRKETDVLHSTVYYDAWENDNDTDPILSLIYSIVRSVPEIEDKTKKLDVGKLIVSVAETVTGIGLTKLYDAAQKSDILDTIKKEKSIHAIMNEIFNVLILEKSERLLIIVDELDRCNPVYAIKLLERIKHYFNDKRVTFLFAINSAELEHTICNYYGTGFNACLYLEKFFDWKFELPQIDYEKCFKEFGFKDSDYVFDRMCHTVAEELKLQYRQMIKYISYAKSTLAYSKAHINSSFSERVDTFCAIYIAPIIIGLQMYDTKKYSEFKNGIKPEPIYWIIKGKYFNANYLIKVGENLNNDKAAGTSIVDANGNSISIQDRLKDVYDALFVKKYENDVIHVGEMLFNKFTVEKLLKSTSML